ncbi:MAG: redoxin domain-containing protein [Candidatus Dormibacteria bacterium]
MAIEVGAPAPEFTLKDETGTPVSLSDFRGRRVVLVFYPMAFSPTCTRELRDLTATAARYQAENAEVVGVSVDSHWTLAAYKRAEGLSARLLADFHPKGEVARLYDAYFEPAGFANRSTVVIDGAGTVAHIVSNGPGEARNADEYLRALAACPA